MTDILVAQTDGELGMCEYELACQLARQGKVLILMKDGQPIVSVNQLMRDHSIDLLIPDEDDDERDEPERDERGNHI
jgi:hypothetical protein